MKRTIKPDFIGGKPTRKTTKRNHAKVTTWRGWGVREPGGWPITCEDIDSADTLVADGRGKLVRIVATCTEVKR